VLVSPPVAPTTIIAIAIPFANDARTTCDLKEANTRSRKAREKIGNEEREREREREKIEKRTKTKGYNRREEERVSFASLRVKPDLHVLIFYRSVHFRWNTESKKMQMERSFREIGFNTYRVY